MRLGAAALGLFLATTISAQPITYGPFFAAPRDHSFAAGVAPHGILLAWSEIDPGSTAATIHVGLFDFDGKPISPVRTLLPSSAGAHANTPAVATDGERFFIAWLELDRSTWAPSRVAGALVDRAATQLSGTINFGRASDGAPMLVWDGISYRVYGHTSYAVSRDGVPAKLAGAPVRQRVPFADPDANGWIDWTLTRSFQCWMGPGCPGSGRYEYTLTWAVVSSQLWIRTGSFRDQDYVAGKPTVLATGDDIVTIWTNGKTLFGLPVVDGRAERLFRLPRNLPYDVSEPDATESLVVFEMANNVWGVPIVGGRAFGEPFPIANSTRREVQPRVYLVGKDRYLVTYIIDREPEGTYLAGRFVEITP